MNFFSGLTVVFVFLAGCHVGAHQWPWALAMGLIALVSAIQWRTIHGEK